jgi:hypothetical protein
MPTGGRRALLTRRNGVGGAAAALARAELADASRDLRGLRAVHVRGGEREELRDDAVALVLHARRRQPHLEVRIDTWPRWSVTICLVEAPIPFITPTCRACSVRSVWIRFAISTALRISVSAPKAPSRKRKVSIWSACGWRPGGGTSIRSVFWLRASRPAGCSR